VSNGLFQSKKRILSEMEICRAGSRRSPVSRAEAVKRPPSPKIPKVTPKEINMKFRTIAIATVFASLMGTAAIHANAMKVDRDHLNGYATMRYTDIYMSGGEKAAVAVSGLGNTTIRLSVYDYNNNLITDTTCRYNTCVLSWVANWNANFYVTVENLSPYSTDYGFAFERE
jgi:hypothetical protein